MHKYTALASLVALATLTISSTAQADPAHSGTLTVGKTTMLASYAWVDGRAVGKIKKKKPVVMQLTPGWHEVWYAMDTEGVVTSCHGLVNVPAGGATTANMRTNTCDGLTIGYPQGPSAFKGAEVAFRIDSAVDAWVSIDGGSKLAFPDMPFLLNLAPGRHTLVLYNDVVDDTVWDQGAFTLRPGERASLTCTVAGCVGFDQPPVFITELHQAPAIVLATPGISIDLRIDASGVQLNQTGANLQMSAGPGGVSVDIDVQDGDESVHVGASIEVE